MQFSNKREKKKKKHFKNETERKDLNHLNWFMKVLHLDIWRNYIVGIFFTGIDQNQENNVFTYSIRKCFSYWKVADSAWNISKFHNTSVA
jgi:hypothetical protein